MAAQRYLGRHAKADGLGQRFQLVGDFLHAELGQALQAHGKAGLQHAGGIAADQGEVAVSTAVAAARGEAIEPEYWVPFERVTRENLAEYRK